ncbi:MAG: winged helix-turn-helix domain-containing protein, partial [Planctomycetota bacterium]
MEIRTAERRVLRDGVPQALGARAFDLLLVLIELRGQVVSKDELLRRVWPGLVVEENNLTVQMTALRKAIGATAISTVPNRGYQLTATLAKLASLPDEAQGNLPTATTRLFGRAADLAAVSALLATERMVTLTGAGGIGKSRLSLQAAEAAASTYADGAWLVELAAVAEPTAVGHAVAGALGVASQPGKTIEQSLT